jgi:RNA polymerase sigma factor (sigma-70 family)
MDAAKSTMSDDLLLRDLLAKLSQGDEAAASQVFLAYEPYLRAVIRRRMPARLRTKLDSVDVMQSAWTDVLEGLRKGNWKFTSPAQLQAFLVRVMRNRCIDRFRQFRRPMEMEQSLAETAPETVPPNAEASPSEEMQADDLWDRMLALSPAEHHPLLKLKRMGAGMEEIVAQTGLHEGSVRRILRNLASRLACEKTDRTPEA